MEMEHRCTQWDLLAPVTHTFGVINGQWSVLYSCMWVLWATNGLPPCNSMEIEYGCIQ